MAFVPTVVWVVNVFFEELPLRDPLTSGIARLSFQVPAAIPDVTPHAVVHWAAFRSKRRRAYLGYCGRHINARRIFESDFLLKDMRSGLRIMADNELGNRLMQCFE